MATIPDEIAVATEAGDVSTVQRWLESGGDPNQNLPSVNSRGFYPEFRLLLIATARDHRAIVSALLEHGADVNYVFTYPSYTALGGDGETALTLAAKLNDLDLARLLLEHGAASSAITHHALDRPRFLRMFLVAGGDASAPTISGRNPEQYVRRRSEYYQHEPIFQNQAAKYAELLHILEGTRLAGSYKQYVLRDFKELLRTRSLLARGRASFGPATPEVIARLFGGRADPAASRRATRRRRPPPPRSAGVPGPVFWKVMEYWRLGDWRHP